MGQITILRIAVSPKRAFSKPTVEVTAYRSADYREAVIPTDAHPLVGGYSSVSQLPEYVQDRLAVLAMLEPMEWPNYIPMLGRKVSDYTFWVEAQDEA